MSNLSGVTAELAIIDTKYNNIKTYQDILVKLADSVIEAKEKMSNNAIQQ